MNGKFVSIVLAYIVLSSALGLIGYFYFDLDRRHKRLQSDYNSLANKYNLLQSNYDELESDYHTLNDTHSIFVNDYISLNRTHQILILDYNELSNNYTTLEQDHTDLSYQYVVLQGQYESLFNDYDALVEAFNDDALAYEEIPSTYELEQWLATDETDEIWYDDPNFVCGDFAVMLSQHAKLEHWDIGVAVVFGYDEKYESYAHVFNAIICREGLVYIEPQIDDVWWYTDHREISKGIWWEFPGEEYIYVEDYIMILWYD